MSTAELSLEAAFARIPVERRRGVATAYAILGALAFLAVWSGFAVFAFEPYVLPPPWAVAAQMWEFTTNGLVLAQFWASLWKTLVGWVMALALGMVLLTVVLALNALIAVVRRWRTNAGDSAPVLAGAAG